MADTDIQITEIHYDPDTTPPQTDNNYEWVEVQNTGTSAVSMAGWRLDDDRTNNANSGLVQGSPVLQAGQVAILYNSNITQADFIAAYNPPPGALLIPVSSWQPLNNTGGDAANLNNASGTLIDNATYPNSAVEGQSVFYVNGVYTGPGTPTPGLVCFGNGTPIDTPNGAQPIETLRVGDLVLTYDHGAQPVRWIGRRDLTLHELHTNPHFHSVLIRAGALGPGMPAVDLRLSQQHRVLMRGTELALLFDLPEVIVPAIALLHAGQIVVEPPISAISYYHLMFDQHELVTSAGLISESFLANSDGLGNLHPSALAEFTALFGREPSTNRPARPVLGQVEAMLLA